MTLADRLKKFVGSIGIGATIFDDIRHLDKEIVDDMNKNLDDTEKINEKYAIYGILHLPITVYGKHDTDLYIIAEDNNHKDDEDDKVKIPVFEGKTNDDNESNDSSFGDYIDNHVNTVYISVGFSHRALWVKTDVLESTLSDMILTYSRGKEPTSDIRGIIGDKNTLDMTLDQIQNTLMSERSNEVLVWGSKWDDHPFRELLMKGVSEEDYFVLNARAMEQSDNYRSISVKTVYSGSIIEVTDYNGIYIVRVKYVPTQHNSTNIANKVYDKEYPDDFPVDLQQVLIPYLFLPYSKLLDVDQIKSDNILIAYLLSMESRDLQTLHDKLTDIVKRDDVASDRKLQKQIEGVLSTLDFDIDLMEVLGDVPLTDYVRDLVDDIGDGAEDVIYDDISEQMSVEMNDKNKYKLKSLIKNIMIGMK